MVSSAVPTGMTFVLTGVREVVVALDLEGMRTIARATAGLLAGGKIVEGLAKANLAGHKDTGRAVAAIQTFGPSVKGPTVGGGSVSVVPHVWVGVGIPHTSAAYPGAYTFEFGWHSGKGKQPPIAPIMAWAMRRGISSDEEGARQAAFAIARSIGKEGYTFGESHWLDDAAIAGAPAVVATVRSALSL